MFKYNLAADLSSASCCESVFIVYFMFLLREIDLNYMFILGKNC